MHKYPEVDFHLLVVFDTLRRTGSVTKTAEHLDLTQGAVSHSLKKLRLLFDDELFIRSKQGISLTSRGEELAAPIADLLVQSEQLLRTHGGFDPSAARRSINLCMNDVGDVAIVPALLNHIHENAPFCTVNTLPLDMSTVTEILADGRADLLISGHEVSGSDIMRQKLYTHRIAVVVQTNCPVPDRIGIEEFCSLDHISVGNMRNMPVPVDRFLEKKGLKRRIVATTTHGTVLPHWLESDPRLVATLPYFMAELWVAKGGFRIVEVDEWLPNFDIFQYWHRRYDCDRFHVWLRKTLRAVVAQHDLSAERSPRQ